MPATVRPLAGVFAVSLCAITLSLDFASAQDVTPADELVRQLEVKEESKPTQEAQTQSATRGIVTRGITINSALAASKTDGRVSFNSIQFEHDSARLTEESTAQLVELGKALSNERLLKETFAIEGHADAHGDDQYNKELSLRRAAAVKGFLSANAGIADARLQAIGKGEEEPKTDDPYDSENRRVDVVNTRVYE